MVLLQASYLYCLVLEYIPGKNLNSHLKTLRRCRMTESGSWPIVRQLIAAIVFLHQLNIVHRLVMSPVCILYDYWSMAINSAASGSTMILQKPIKLKASMLVWCGGCALARCCHERVKYRMSRGPRDLCSAIGRPCCMA